METSHETGAALPNPAPVSLVAQKALQRLAVLSQRTYVFPSSFARVYLGLGDTDAAFKWLERAFAERDVAVLALKVSPILDSLRSDPRYANLLRRAGFAL